MGKRIDRRYDRFMPFEIVFNPLSVKELERLRTLDGDHMKPFEVDELKSNAAGVLDRAQRERVVIMRLGKPCAVVIGVEHYDAEDFELARSAEFWQMIES